MKSTINIKSIMESSPVIVVGMHRSGTTLLVEILENCGIFMGKNQTGNRESVFFQDVNKEILDMMGVSWRCLDFLPSVSELSSHMVWARQRIQKRINEGLMDNHFGFEQLQKMDFDSFWGWKDPRTSLLLPVWKDIFPKAKIVHVIRDGRKVARSLLLREIKREKESFFFSQEEMVRRYVSGIELWESYVRRISGCISHFGVTHTIRYEELMRSPAREIEICLEKLSVKSIDRKTINKLSETVDPNRWQKKTDRDFSWMDTLSYDRTFLNECGYGY